MLEGAAGSSTPVETSFNSSFTMPMKEEALDENYDDDNDDDDDGNQTHDNLVLPTSLPQPELEAVPSKKAKKREKTKKEIEEEEREKMQ